MTAAFAYDGSFIMELKHESFDICLISNMLCVWQYDEYIGVIAIDMVSMVHINMGV